MGDQYGLNVDGYAFSTAIDSFHSAAKSMGAYVGTGEVSYKIDGDQNYLDCYDDFTMMFFIGEGMTWVKTRIYINGWRVVPPQDVDM